MVARSPEATMTHTMLLPFRPEAMTPAQLAAVSYLARYTGHTHTLYAYQLRRWFAWCETNALDPLVGIQRAHLELYIRHLGQGGLRVSSVNTMMHGVRGSSGSPTSTASSPPTRPSTPGYPKSTAMSRAPRAWTGLS
jgi:hypothetical protein